jgi:hypothetical protein
MNSKIVFYSQNKINLLQDYFRILWKKNLVIEGLKKFKKSRYSCIRRKYQLFLLRILNKLN